MARVLALRSLGGELTLDGSNGVQAKSKARGFGLPDVATQWFEGAGDGASFRGGRVLPRVLELTIKVYGRTPAAVRDRLALVGRIFQLRSGPVRLSCSIDGEPWFVLVRRTGGGDWDWDSDTDGKTFVKTVLTVQAGDPYWTREDEETRSVTPGGLSSGLLFGGSLSALKLSTTTAQGQVQIENTGDVDAFPVTTVFAPFTGFELTSPAGERIIWGTAGNGVAGAAKASGFVVVNHDLGTVVDELGANRYGGLGDVPRFWAVEPGLSTATITTFGAGAGTHIDMIWQPRREVMF
jgi:hypothetical protein